MSQEIILPRKKLITDPISYFIFSDTEVGT